MVVVNREPQYKIYERVAMKFNKLDTLTDLNMNLNVNDNIIINCNALNTNATVSDFKEITIF